jgi:signal transduction histidine kinase
VDGRALQQALVNLLDNAIKHSAKGETVTVGIEQVPPSPPGARVHDPQHVALSKPTVNQPPPAPERRPPGELPVAPGARVHDPQHVDAPTPPGIRLPSPPAGGVLRLMEPRTGDASVIHLWVADHGPGIPAAEHERIFERFYRRGSELRRETQGIGIGLSIVKHIMTAHGGRVLVDSAPGRGSRFTLELPAETTESRERKAETGKQKE